MSDTDSLDIKKRARRRLVGAIALALLAIIVLPMVMDSEPMPMSQDIQVTIPDRHGDSTLVRPLASEELSDSVSGDIAASPEQDEVTPPRGTAGAPPPAAVPAPPSAVASAPSSPSAPSAPSQPAVAGAPAQPAVPAKPPLPASAEEAARVQAILNNQPSPALKGIFILQLGAFSDASKADAMVQALKAQNLPTYTEKAGAVIRVRVGPYTSRVEAEQVAARLKAQGRPSVIAAR